MRRVGYSGLDAHVHDSVLAEVGMDGKLVNRDRLSTCKPSIVGRIVAVAAKKKLWALEESTLAAWPAGMRRGYVNKLVVCDPCHSALIGRSANKDDYEDAFRLARLLRMGELRSITRIISTAAPSRLSRSLKTAIKMQYPKAGILRVDRTTVFSAVHRKRYLKQLPNAPSRKMVSDSCGLPDSMIAARQKARDHMIRLGRWYLEVQQFMQMSDVGPFTTRIFNVFI